MKFSSAGTTAGFARVPAGLALAAALLFLATAAYSQQAITIDQDGAVTIPGQLTVGSVQAGNLDKTLAEIMAQNQALAAQIAQQNSDASWFTFSDTVASGLPRGTDTNLLNNEFGVMEAKGFRHAQFSKFQNKVMLMTEPFMTETVTNGQTALRMGGTVYLPSPLSIKVKIGAEIISISLDCAAPNVVKLPYGYDANGAEVIFYPFPDQICAAAGPVYARKRLFR